MRGIFFIDWCVSDVEEGGGEGWEECLEDSGPEEPIALPPPGVSGITAFRLRSLAASSSDGPCSGGGRTDDASIVGVVG